VYYYFTFDPNLTCQNADYSVYQKNGTVVTAKFSARNNVVGPMQFSPGGLHTVTASATNLEGTLFAAIVSFSSGQVYMNTANKGPGVGPGFRLITTVGPMSARLGARTVVVVMSGDGSSSGSSGSSVSSGSSASSVPETGSGSSSQPGPGPGPRPRPGPRPGPRQPCGGAPGDTCGEGIRECCEGFKCRGGTCCKGADCGWEAKRKVLHDFR
jgi:hypothetical protein